MDFPGVERYGTSMAFDSKTLPYSLLCYFNDLDKFYDMTKCAVCFKTFLVQSAPALSTS